MKRAALAMTILLFASTYVCAEEEPEPVPNPELATSEINLAATCDQSIEQWWAWRDRQIDYLLTTSDCEGEPCFDINDLAFRAREISEFLKACSEREPELYDPAGMLGSMVQNLGRFADAVGLQDDPAHRMGFTIPDREYLDTYREEITLPELLRSEPFLEAVSDPATYQQAYEMIQARNEGAEPGDQWISFLYKSRFLKTPDETTYGRFFVYVPGEIDKWIQFGIVTPDMENYEINSASIVSVTREPGERFFRTGWVIDYWRAYSDNGIELKTKVEAGEGGANCYNCHKMPVLPIHPHEVYTFGEHGELVVETVDANEIPDRLNVMIEEYGRVDFGKHMDTDGYGPSVGPPDRERSLEQLRAWSGDVNVTDDQLRKIRHSMTCARCHHSSYMGRLNYPTSVASDQDTVDLLHPVTGLSSPLIKTYIEEGWMPPGNKLTVRERKALYNCITREYYSRGERQGVLLDWLRAVAH